MAGPTSTLHLGIGVDTRAFARFAKALRAAEPQVRRALMLRLRSVGELVAEEARAAVSEVSSTVAASIRVRVSGATVSVVAGGTGVPLAGLLELGPTRQRDRAPATWSHPVFGNRAAFVPQATHPYLTPAVHRQSDAVEAAAVNALDEAVLTIVEGD